MNNVKKLAAFTGIVLSGCLYSHKVNENEGNIINNTRDTINNTVNIDKNKQFIRATVDQIKYYSDYLIQANIMYDKLEKKSNTTELNEEELQYMSELEKQIILTQAWIKFHDKCITIAQEEITLGKSLSYKTDLLLQQEEYKILFSKEEKSINI